MAMNSDPHKQKWFAKQIMENGLFRVVSEDGTVIITGCLKGETAKQVASEHNRCVELDEATGSAEPMFTLAQVRELLGPMTEEEEKAWLDDDEEDRFDWIASHRLASITPKPTLEEELDAILGKYSPHPEGLTSSDVHRAEIKAALLALIDKYRGSQPTIS